MNQVSLCHSPHSQRTALERSYFSSVLLAGICLLFSGCTQSKRPVTEAPPLAPPMVAASQDSADARVKLPPPTIDEVQRAVTRIFKEAAVVDATRTPAFVSGDFNGDLSSDLAVVLQPVAEKLAELNEDYPNWILRDPFTASEQRVPRLRISASDLLLAVIHGYGPNGWRDPQATQTFLLKNAVGSALQARTGKDALAMSQSKKIPRVRGDVIGEEIGHVTGYLYYAGAGYSWYDPMTFKGDDPMPGAVHMAPKDTARK